MPRPARTNITTGSRASVLASCALMALACACSRTTTATSTWFDAHRPALVATRDMLAADRGLVTSLFLATSTSTNGTLRGVTGRNGSCSSSTRTGVYPWHCTGGIGGRVDERTTAADASAVEQRLGLAPGRLAAYAKLIPASVGSAEPCAPHGSLRFSVADHSTAPCTGLDDVVWAPSTPDPASEPTCRASVSLAYVSLGDGFYDETCGASPASPSSATPR